MQIGWGSDTFDACIAFKLSSNTGPGWQCDVTTPLEVKFKVKFIEIIHHQQHGIKQSYSVKKQLKIP